MARMSICIECVACVMDELKSTPAQSIKNRVDMARHGVADCSTVMDSTWQSVVLTSGQLIVFEILVSWLTATWHFRITSTMWLASAFISYASYVSSDGPWWQMLHTRWFGPWSTPESTTVTDSWPPISSTCTRSYSPSSVPPPDMFCSSHIKRLFPELCEDSCTGSRCQIVSDSNCVPLYTDVCTNSRLLTCLISACLPQSTLIWDHLWHSNGRCQSKTLGPRGFYFALSAAWNALPVHMRDPELSLNSFKTILKTHFFPDPTWATFII